jgi:hypothetical protein
MPRLPTEWLATILLLSKLIISLQFLVLLFNFDCAAKLLFETNMNDVAARELKKNQNCQKQKANLKGSTTPEVGYCNSNLLEC